jgi:hypothetical protein
MPLSATLPATGEIITIPNPILLEVRRCCGWCDWRSHPPLPPMRRQCPWRMGCHCWTMPMDRCQPILTAVAAQASVLAVVTPLGPWPSLLVQREGSGVRLKKGSHNQHVVGGCVWQSMWVGGAQRPSRLPSETTSLAPAERRGGVLCKY